MNIIEMSYVYNVTKFHALQTTVTQSDKMKIIPKCLPVDTKKRKKKMNKNRTFIDWCMCEYILF